MISNGGTLNHHQAGVNSFYNFWGDRHHWLMVAFVPVFLACSNICTLVQLKDVAPEHSGLYVIQLLYGNGAGPGRTGIACSLKWLLIYAHQGNYSCFIRATLFMPDDGLCMIVQMKVNGS